VYEGDSQVMKDCYRIEPLKVSNSSVN